ncbi:MAG: hypothetical protein DHS20C19_01490 [Acidimicrobiales bacterium]|nr:MAG: hypothetical protein DHS20C19_01490 [Acidimicrobiales bacterium]
MFRRPVTIPTPLAASELGQTIPADELRVLSTLGTEIRFAAGRVAMTEDAVGRECMLVIDGSFAVERLGERVAELRAGDFMGEVALLTGQPRNATVTALEDSTAHAFSRREFSSLLGRCPTIAARVNAAAKQRTLVAA